MLTAMAEQKMLSVVGKLAVLVEAARSASAPGCYSAGPGKLTW